MLNTKGLKNEILLQAGGKCPYIGKRVNKLPVKGCPALLSKGKCPYIANMKNCPKFKNIGNCTFVKKNCPFFAKGNNCDFFKVNSQILFCMNHDNINSFM